jgi:hypothetical protein
VVFMLLTWISSIWRHFLMILFLCSLPYRKGSNLALAFWRRDNFREEISYEILVEASEGYLRKSSTIWGFEIDLREGLLWCAMQLPIDFSLLQLIIIRNY